MRLRTLALGALGAISLITLAGASAVYAMGQRPDYGWRPSGAPPTYQGARPLVLLDEGHNNASTAGLFGRYRAFADLLWADGYRVERRRGRLSPAALGDVDVLVIANAAGAPRAQFWGFNLPVPEQGDRASSAFTSAEVEAISGWVSRGGALLLVADHAPFGSAASSLAESFGITMHQGHTEIPGESPDPMLFDRTSGRLGTHPILEQGSRGGGRIERIQTFTGQSLDGPTEASALLLLPENAVEYVSGANDAFIEAPAGAAQAYALEFGQGRVVVLGEAAMITAQVSEGARFGMNAAENDNEQFALNVMHWLSGTD